MSTVNLSPSTPPADVTDDRGAYPESWYIALTRSNAERTTADRLARCGYTVYVPVQTVVRRWSDRLKKIERCIIPMVVFVRADRSRVLALQRLGIARGLMRAPGESSPATVPDEQIAMLRFMTDRSDTPVGFTPATFAAGQRVRVVRGRLRGLEGTVIDAAGCRPASSTTLPAPSSSKADAPLSQRLVNPLLARRTLSIQIDHLGCATITLPSSDCQPC